MAATVQGRMDWLRERDPQKGSCVCEGEGGASMNTELEKLKKKGKHLILLKLQQGKQEECTDCLLRHPARVSALPP